MERTPGQKHNNTTATAAMPLSLHYRHHHYCYFTSLLTRDADLDDLVGNLPAYHHNPPFSAWMQGPFTGGCRHAPGQESLERGISVLYPDELGLQGWKVENDIEEKTENEMEQRKLLHAFTSIRHTLLNISGYYSGSIRNMIDRTYLFLAGKVLMFELRGFSESTLANCEIKTSCSWKFNGAFERPTRIRDRLDRLSKIVVVCFKRLFNWRKPFGIRSAPSELGTPNSKQSSL